MVSAPWLVVVVISLTLLHFVSTQAIVETENGLVRGVATEFSRSFKGVPFIAPPVGDLRFAKPAPVSSWKPNTYDATKFKPGCPQVCVLPPGTCPLETSEDCIYLNIYTPGQTSSQNLPVFAFLPGGHFEQGTAGVELYDGSYFANKTNVIVVVIGYRLGALGWLTNAAIDGMTGNFGFYDQRAALQWIQRNIANFGGDPSKVTLAGQSAGATSTVAHLISPLSKGLFQQAIVHSDPITLPMRDTADASTLGAYFAQLINCTTIECLRSKSTDEIVAVQHEAAKKTNLKRPIEKFLPWVVTMDGTDVPLEALDAFEKGSYSQVPIMIGTTAEEALLFIYMASNTSISSAQYLEIVAAVFHMKTLSVDKMYPSKPMFGDKRPMLSILGTDYIFICPNRHLASLSSKFNSLYLYEFNTAMTFDGWGERYKFCVGHACHGVELPYLFHAFSNYTVTSDEYKLSDLMIQYWGNFIKTGNPNQSGLPEWPKFTTNEYPLMELKTPASAAKTDVRGMYCNYWDKVGYHYGW